MFSTIKSDGCYYLIPILYIIYYILGIYYLSTYFNTHWNCPSTSIWMYILTSLIISILIQTIKYLTRKKSTNNKFGIYCAATVINLWLSIWGGLMISNICKILYHTRFMNFAISTFILQCIEIFVNCISSYGSVQRDEYDDI